MKQLTAIILCLIMVFSLCACGVKTDKNDDPQKFTEPPEATAPDGRPVYSDSPLIEYPQTGEYKETALLTNVPGQKLPLLLDMRQDGTIDYLFTGVEQEADFQSFVETGACYYTISPDGTATKQDTAWMEEIDHYLDMTLETTQDPNGKWRFRFAAEEGTLLILAQYHDMRRYMDAKILNIGFVGMVDGIEVQGQVQHSVLFKVVDGKVTIVPIDWEFDLDGESFQLNTEYIINLLLEDEMAVFQTHTLTVIPTVRTVKYQLNGTLADVETVNTHESDLYYLGIQQNTPRNGKEIPLLPESMTYYASVGAWTHVDSNVKQYTEKDSLYNLKKSHSSILVGDFSRYTFHPNMKMIVYGEDGDFCCWFDEVGLGVLMRYDYNPEGKIDPEIVTVWSWEPIELIKTAVAQWNHTHASPIFRYETGVSELKDTTLTEEDIITRLNLELLNGQGPDVMILDGLNVDKYKEFMVPLNGLNTEDVYESIKNRFTVGNELLVLPARVTPYLLGRLAEGTEDINSLTQFADIITTSTSVLDVGSHGPGLLKLSGMYNVSDYAQLFRLWYPAWADAIWEGGKLNKDVFKEFLIQTNRLSEHYTMNWVTTSTTEQLPLLPDIYSFDELENSWLKDRVHYLRLTDPNVEVLELIPNATDLRVIPYTLDAQGHVGLFTYWLAREDMKNDTQSVAHYIDAIPGKDGTGTMVPSVITGVRAGGNEEAGLEFVQLLLSAEMQQGLGYYCPPLADGYPVTWSDTEALMDHMEAYMGQACAVENSFEETMNSLRTTVIDEFLCEAAMDVARQYYRGEPTQAFIDAGYTWDPITADEAVEMLDELSRIYLAEKR